MQILTRNFESPAKTSLWPNLNRLLTRLPHRDRSAAIAQCSKSCLFVYFYFRSELALRITLEWKTQMKPWLILLWEVYRLKWTQSLGVGSGFTPYKRQPYSMNTCHKFM